MLRSIVSKVIDTDYRADLYDLVAKAEAETAPIRARNLEINRIINEIIIRYGSGKEYRVGQVANEMNINASFFISVLRLMEKNSQVEIIRRSKVYFRLLRISH